MVKSVLPLLGAIAILLASSVPAPAQPKLLEPVNLGKHVNTKGDETDPFLLPDNTRLFYSSNISGNFEMWVAKRESLIAPFNLADAAKQLNKKGFDTRSPFYFLPLKEFYYATNKLPEEALKDEKNYDIYVQPSGGAAGALQETNTPVDELFPWITANGNEMFFSRKLKDGWRLCVTRGPKIGPPDKGKIMEEFPAGFHHCTVTPDGLTMFLQGPLDKDRTGLFRSTRKKIGGAWEKPLPLVNLNHPETKQGDQSPSLSQNGLTMYYASDRPGGQGGLDLYSILVADLKTE